MSTGIPREAMITCPACLGRGRGAGAVKGVVRVGRAPCQLCGGLGSVSSSEAEDWYWHTQSRQLRGVVKDFLRAGENEGPVGQMKGEERAMFDVTEYVGRRIAELAVEKGYIASCRVSRTRNEKLALIGARIAELRQLRHWVWKEADAQRKSP